MSDTVERLQTRGARLLTSGVQWLRSLALDLHRRRVSRAVVTYGIAAWIVLQIADVLFPLFGFSALALKVLACVSVTGLPLTVIFAWIYQMTPNGLVVDRSQGLLSRGAHQDFTVVFLTICGAAAFLVLIYAGEPERSRSVAIAATEVVEPGVPGTSMAARLEEELQRQLHSDELEPVSTFSESAPAAFVLWVHLTSSRERVHVRLILLEAEGGASAPFVHAFDVPRLSAREVERRIAERIASEVRPRLAAGSDVRRLSGFVWKGTR